MTIKEQFAANIKLYWDGRKGTLIDQSGNGHNGTFSGTPVWRNSSKGKELAFDAGTNTVVIPSFNIDYSAFTIFAVFNFSKTQVGTTYGVIASKDSVGSNNRFFSVNLLNADDKISIILFKNSSEFTLIATTDAVPRNTDLYIACVYTFVSDNNSIIDLYVNGVKAATQITNARGPLDPDTTTDLSIGGSKFASFENEFLGNIREFGMMDVALTSQQVSQLYEESLQEPFIGTLPKRDFQLTENVTGTESNLVGGWNLKTQNNQVIDVSTGDNDMTKNGNMFDTEGLFGRAIKFDGSTGFLRKTVANYRSSDSSGSIAIWAKPNSFAATGYFIMSADTGTAVYYFAIGIVSSSGIIAVVQKNNDTAENIRTTNGLVVNEWSHVVVTSNGTRYKMYINGVEETLTISGGANNGDWFGDTTNRDNLVMGAFIFNSTVNHFNGLIDSVKVYSAELTATEITALYQKGARKVNYQNDFSDEPVTVTALGSGDIGGFHIDSGTWKISDDGTDKWLENVTNGIVYFESQQAFGTWQFDIYKGADFNTTKVSYMADVIGSSSATGQDGYTFSISAPEDVLLIRTTNGSAALLMNSSDSYVVIQTKYSIRLTRRYDGQFTQYIKGGAFTTWTIIDSSFTGSNPKTDITTTTSKYFLLDVDSGDKISNIKFYEGVVSPNDLE